MIHPFHQPAATISVSDVSTLLLVDHLVEDVRAQNRVVSLHVTRSDYAADPIVPNFLVVRYRVVTFNYQVAVRLHADDFASDAEFELVTRFEARLAAVFLVHVTSDFRVAIRLGGRHEREATKLDPVGQGEVRMCFLLAIHLAVTNEYRLFVDQHRDDVVKLELFLLRWRLVCVRVLVEHHRLTLRGLVEHASALCICLVDVNHARCDDRSKHDH